MFTEVLTYLHPPIMVLRGGLTSWAMLAWDRTPVIFQWWRKGVGLLMWSWVVSAGHSTVEFKTLDVCG